MNILRYLLFGVLVGRVILFWSLVCYISLGYAALGSYSEQQIQQKQRKQRKQPIYMKKHITTSYSHYSIERSDGMLLRNSIHRRITNENLDMYFFFLSIFIWCGSALLLGRLLYLLVHFAYHRFIVCVGD